MEVYFKEPSWKELVLVVDCERDGLVLAGVESMWPMMGLRWSD